MKKILVIAAAALCAVVTQAASVSWSATNVNKGGTNLDKNTITGYLFDSAVVTQQQVIDALANGTFDSLKSQSLSNPGTSTVTAGAVQGAAKPVSDTDYPSGKSVTAFAVIFDSGSMGTSGNYIITGAKTKTMSGSGGTSFALGTQATNNTWTAYGSSPTPPPQPVPEPCSVALIALGLAAFGLKRKVA